MKIKIKYVSEDVDRHGNVRLYVRQRGYQKVRLETEPGTAEFAAEVRAALQKQEQGRATEERRRAVQPGTLHWLCVQYYEGANFKTLAARTRTVRRGILDKICMKKGAKPYAKMEPRHVCQLRDARIDAPEAANGIVKALRQVFDWAMLPEIKLASHNPARDVPYLASANPDGFHTWTIEEIWQFEERHPLGTKARLALALLLFSGPRRADVVTFGPPMVRAGVIRWTELKGRARTPKHRELPILPELQQVIDATPCGHLVFLTTEFGRPFSVAGFGNWFRKRCDEAGLKHCAAHGLRKAGATIAAGNGATEHQLMAIYGWESPKQAALYTKKANRKKLAAGAMHLVVPEHMEGKSAPPKYALGSGGTFKEKKP